MTPLTFGTGDGSGQDIRRREPRPLAITHTCIFESRGHPLLYCGLAAAEFAGNHTHTSPTWVVQVIASPTQRVARTKPHAVLRSPLLGQ